ncbi:MAG TPA: endo-1,4-beta-xylanase, partial [Bacillaceae bacterium]|nr:endo-1,4-beta-xylanase [Bacillaceae bacterium]
MGKRFSILLTLLLVANLLIPPSMMSFAETEEESLPQLKFDFEDGTTQGWGARGGSVILTPTADAAYSGDYGLHVSGRVDAWNGTTIDVTDFMEVGKTYSLSAWARLPEGMPSSGVSVLIERHTDGTAHYEHVNGKTASDDTWVLISGEYTLKHPVERISVYFEAFDEPELEFYLDDIVIQEVPAPEPIVIEDDIPSLKDVFADHFKLGAAILSNEVEDPNGPDAQLLKKHYNSLTPGNELKWDATEPQEGVFNFTGSDKIVEFAEENGIAVRGHTLIWHSQTPNWVFYDDEGNLASKELLYERMKRHIETVMGRYKGKIYAWDVVNEVIEIGDRQPNGLRNSLWYQIAGEEFIEKAFEYAHAADPDAILYINDYNTHIPDRRDAMYDLVKRLKDKGIPVHGVGHQNHISITYPSLNEMDMMIEKFRDLGVRQEITELDMSIYSSDSQSYETFPYELQVEQALRYKDLFDIFKKHSDQLDAVIFWGKDDLNTWLRTFPVTRNNWPLLFDERMQAKLAYWALVDPTKLPAPIQELDANFGTPNIDGKKDLVWETVPAKSFNIADDIPVSFKTLWDDENLYVWTEVKDKTVNKNDLVEIFIHDENGILHNKINRKGKNQHHYKVKEGKDGYVAEIKISKEELAIGQE